MSPTVPRYQRTQQTGALPGARLSPSAPEGAFGGNTLPNFSAATREIAGILADERQKADQIAITDADGKLSELETTLQLQAQQRRGKDAFGAPEEIMQSWDDGVSKVTEGLGADRQRLMLKQHAAARRQSLFGAVQRHVAGERKAYDDQVTESYLTNSRNRAIVNYQNTPEVEGEIDRQRAVITDHARRNGMPKEWIEEKTAAAASATHLGVIERYLTTGEDRSATAYYKAHKTEVIGTDAARVEKALEVGSTEGEGMRAASLVWKQLGPKSPNDPVRIASMEQAIRDMGGGATALPETPAGLIEAGNINLANRPRVKNADGSISTVRSISVEIDGKEVLLPTVSEDGKILTDKQAIAQYEATGKHLGIFKDAASATAYAQALHEQQASTLTGSTLDLKSQRAAMQELRSRAQAFNAEQTELSASNSAAVLGAFNRGTPLSTLVTMPQYRALSGTEQERIKSYVVDRSRQLTERAANTSQKRNWVAYWENSEPSKLAGMSESQIVALEPDLGPALTNQLIEKKRALTRRADGVIAATMDADQFNTLAKDAGFRPYGGDNDDKETLGRLRNAVETEIGRVQEKANRQLARDEKTEVMKSIIDDKVMVDRFGTDDKRVRATVEPVDRAKAYLPLEEVPAEWITSALNVMRSSGRLPPGTNDAIARQQFKRRLERAYAARLYNAPAAEINAILFGQK